MTPRILNDDERDAWLDDHPDAGSVNTILVALADVVESTSETASKRIVDAVLATFTPAERGAVRQLAEECYNVECDMALEDELIALGWIVAPVITLEDAEAAEKG
jgi:hypothetical protein